MQKATSEKPKDAIDPQLRVDPVPEARNTLIETYIATGEGNLKLTSFYVRVNRKDPEKSPFRRLIEEARDTTEAE